MNATGSTRQALALLVPAGAAVFTWLVVLVFVAYAASVGPLTLTRLFEAILVAALAWPVAKLAPWRPGIHDRLRWWLRTRWPTFLLAAGLLVATPLLAGLGGPGLVLAVLRFPVETVELFRLAAFVRGHAGAEAAAALLFVARFLLQALWALLLGAVLIAAGRGLVRR